MKIFQTYKTEKGKHQINRGLLWEYRLEDFDWQKYRRVVVERVIKMGRLSDWYGAFDLYGGIRGFRKIARDEVVDLTPRELEFVCMALNINKTETRCYKQEQLRRQHLGDAIMTDNPDKVYLTAPLKKKEIFLNPRGIFYDCERVSLRRINDTLTSNYTTINVEKEGNRNINYRKWIVN